MIEQKISFFTEDQISSADDSEESSLSSLTNSVEGLFAKISTGMGTIVQSTIEKDLKESFYNVDIGYGNKNFIFKKMQPENCTINLTNEEYDDEGYPIFGEITMSFKSYHPPVAEGISSNKIIFGYNPST